MQDLNALVAEACRQFADIADSAHLEEAKAGYLGKSGSLTELLKGLGKLSAEERKPAGERINAAKAEIESALNLRREQLANQKLEAKLAAERPVLRSTMPSTPRSSVRTAVRSTVRCVCSAPRRLRSSSLSTISWRWRSAHAALRLSRASTKQALTWNFW